MSEIDKLKRIISEALRKGIESIQINQEPLFEMARLNLNEYGNVPFPTNKFDIRIWSNDHNPPHFHVIAEGWNISFLIETGEILKVNETGNDSKMYTYIVKNIPIWLNMKNKRVPTSTNQMQAMFSWESLHS